MRKLRVLIINPGPIHDLHAQFSERLELLSQSCEGSFLSTGVTASGATIAGFDATLLHVRRSVKFISNPLLLWKFYSFMRDRDRNGFGYDLVVTYDPLKTGIAGVLARRVFGAKLCCEVNGDYLDTQNYADTSSWILRIAKRTAYKFVMKFVLSRADGIKLLFATQLDPIAEKIGLANKRVAVIPSYVNLEPFKVVTGDDVVLFTGYPMYRKGLDVLVKAFKMIATKHPTWELKILGWYPDKARLAALTDGHTQISHHEAVVYSEMPAHVMSSSIFVLPSRSEAMGRVLVESMAAGKARIGSQVGGIPSVINDQVDGLLFESENSDDLAQKLDFLMSNATERERLGRNAAERAIRNHSLDVINEKNIRLYESVVESS